MRAVSKKLEKRLIRAIVAVAVLAIAGYVSSLVTRGRCEAFGMTEIIEGVSLPSGQNVPVFILPDHSPRSEAALRSAGLAVQKCQADPAQFDCFSWADVSSVVMPFLVSVKWEHVTAPLSGCGRSALFFCMFGLRWPIQEHDLWVT